MAVADKTSMISRRKFMALIGGLACVPVISGCAPKAQPITIGLQAWPGYEPAPLSRALGWLDAKQVKLVENGSSTDSLKQLEQGKIDGAYLTLDEVLRSREKGIPLAVLLVCDISAGADMLLARPEIKTLSDIKGRRVGVEKDTLGALMLHEVLQAAGLKPEDIQPVWLKNDQQADAWKQGTIDAVITYEPAASHIMTMEAKKLLDSRQIPETILDVLAVRATVLDDAHDEALRHLVASHLRALHYINTSPEDAAYRMAPRLKLPPEQVLATFRGLVLPDLNHNRRLLATPPPALLKRAGVIANTMFKAGLLHRQADLNGLLRPEFLPRTDL